MQTVLYEFKATVGYMRLIQSKREKDPGSDDSHLESQNQEGRDRKGYGWAETGV